MPLRKLTQKFVKEPEPEQGYIEQLDRVFSHTISENRLLQSKINQYRLSMQKSVLDALISGGTEGGARDFDDIEPFFTMESDNRIFVVCMRCKGEAFPAKETAEIIRTSLPEGDACAILEEREDGAAFVFNYSGPEQPKEAVIQQLLMDMYQEKGYLAALSNGSASPLDVPALYENAQRASQFWAQEPVVLYDAVRESLPSRAAVAYPHERINALTTRLGENDFAAARAEIQILFRLLDEAVYDRPEMRRFFVRSILIDILSTVVSAMNQAHIKFKSYSDLYFETLYFSRSFLMSKRRRKFRRMSGSCWTCSRKAWQTRHFCAAIQRVVQENCFSPDFSIALLADHFQVSIAYMSLQFKKGMGENFRIMCGTPPGKGKAAFAGERSVHRRNQRCRGLLTLPVFRRKFKQETGISPSQMRGG